jgi:hypothetical protein
MMSLPRASRPGRRCRQKRLRLLVTCELPAQHGMPLARWSLTELHPAIDAHGLVAQVSRATGQRR